LHDTFASSIRMGHARAGIKFLATTFGFQVMTY